MKKLLAITVVGLLFVLIDSINPTKVEAISLKDLNKKRLEEEKNMGFFERQINKYKKHKRKKEYCAEESSYAKTDFAAKKIYKACMDD